MTMFSSKPKFDLAEFLAVPAPVSSAGFRGARNQRKWMASSQRAEATETLAQAEAEAGAAPAATDDDTKA